MSSLDQKIQIYISEKLKKEIQQKAEMGGVSLSKYVSRILEDHMAYGRNDESFQEIFQRFELRNKATLNMILGHVYDQENYKKNIADLKDAIAAINKTVEERIGSLKD